MTKYAEDIGEIKTDVKWIIQAIKADKKDISDLEDRVNKTEKKLAWYGGAIAVISGIIGFIGSHVKELFNHI